MATTTASGRCACGACGRLSEAEGAPRHTLDASEAYALSLMRLGRARCLAALELLPQVLDLRLRHIEQTRFLFEKCVST